MGDKEFEYGIYLVNDKTGEKMNLLQIPQVSISDDDKVEFCAEKENISLTIETDTFEKLFDQLNVNSKAFDHFCCLVNIAIRVYLAEIKHMEKENGIIEEANL